MGLFGFGKKKRKGSKAKVARKCAWRGCHNNTTPRSIFCAKHNAENRKSDKKVKDWLHKYGG